jgi:glycosyltransferase involved in cell wall biosynthesis
VRIALICRNLHTAGGRVVGINFVRSLKNIGNNHQYLIVASENAGYENLEIHEDCEMSAYTGGGDAFKQWWFDTYELPGLVKRFKADVAFAMGNIGMVNPPCPQAILFHKPHLVYPLKHYANETKRARFKNYLLKLRMRRCLKKTRLVFCQTDVAKQRFNSSFNFPLEQIKIMPNAVSEFIKVSRDQTQVPEALKTAGYYSLFFLTKFYAHKNLEMVIELFRHHREELKNVRCIVTVDPTQHPRAPKFTAKIRQYALENHVINVGPLKQSELAGYFYYADALLFPSLMESFSGTYLEAMHFGLPILTSDLDFARLVCHDAALYFNPWNSADIANKISRLKNDPELGEQLISKGKKRIKSFFMSWEQITRNTIGELEKLVREHNRKALQN